MHAVFKTVHLLKNSGCFDTFGNLSKIIIIIINRNVGTHTQKNLIYFLNVFPAMVPSFRAHANLE